jgi:predicted metal-dependent hydrolase
MSTETVLKVAGLTINVVRKDIKNLHLGVYPPAGRVRVAAPLVISDEAVRLAVIDKLAWIKLQRSKFEQQPRQSEREMAVGESHYKLGVQASAWVIKRMKTKWGSCTPASRRVWLNSELAKKPVECIEYIVVHELLHLAEPNHGERFVALMNRYLPQWPSTQKRLNAAPLGHEEWGC